MLVNIFVFIFQNYTIIDSIIILIVRAVLKMKHRFIFSFDPRYTNQRTTLLSKISDVIGSGVSVFPDEHLYNILVYGSNVFNSVSNGLIITETTTYKRNSGRFIQLVVFN